MKIRAHEAEVLVVGTEEEQTRIMLKIDVHEVCNLLKIRCSNFHQKKVFVVPFVYDSKGPSIKVQFGAAQNGNGELDEAVSKSFIRFEKMDTVLEAKEHCENFKLDVSDCEILIRAAKDTVDKYLNEKTKQSIEEVLKKSLASRLAHPP